MCVAIVFTIAGLFLGAVSAVLMWLFPPHIQRFSEKGEPLVTWRAAPIEEKKRIGRLQIQIAKFAPLLLVFAFLLQLVGVLTCFIARSPLLLRMGMNCYPSLS